MKNRTKEIKKLEAEIEKLMIQVRNRRDKIKKLESQREFETTGFKVGDLIEDRSGQRGILTRFNGHSWFWRKLKKDGNPRATEQHLYHFEEIKKVVSKA